MISQDSIPGLQHQGDYYVTTEKESLQGSKIKEQSDVKNTFEVTEKFKVSDQGYPECDSKEHIKESNHVSTGYTCKDCGHKYKQKINFMLHQTKGCGKEKIPLKRGHKSCEGHQSYSISSESYILESHDIKIERNFQCDECSYRCTCDLTFDSHTALKHGEKRLFRCNYCDFECYKEVAMNIHKATHSEATSFKCPQCPFATVDADHLLRHSNWHVKPFSCSLCGISCKSSQTLKHHVKEKHLDIKKKQYTCSECSFSTEIKGFLGKHKLLHSTDRPFACPKCTYRFYRQALLDRHSLTHETTRKFSCRYCHFSFKLDRTLVSHLKHVHCS